MYLCCFKCTCTLEPLDPVEIKLDQEAKCLANRHTGKMLLLPKCQVACQFII